MTSPPGDFGIRWERLDDETGLVVVDGEIDLATAPRVAAVFPRLTMAGIVRVVLDLGTVEFIDSSGISVLLNAQRRLTRAGGRLVVARPTPSVLRLLQLVRLDSTLEIELTRDAALDRLAQRPQAGWRLVRDPRDEDAPGAGGG